MLLESACVPIPSEIIMPFSGYLVFSEKFSLWQAVFWGTIGNLAGSILAYFVGFYGGRPFIEKYGGHFWVSRRELDLADAWFAKYGTSSVFFSRLLPAVRTFISLPAGVAKMPFGKFCFYTFAGCLPWAFFLTYIGIVLGENWQEIEVYFRKFDLALGIFAILTVSWLIYKKIKIHKKA